MAQTAESGKNTSEYRLMIKYTPKINTALSIAEANIILLCPDLLNEGLISAANDQELKTPYMSIFLRAANLTGIVRGKVELNAKNFQKFIKVLEKHSETFKEVLKELKEGESDLNYCDHE